MAFLRTHLACDDCSSSDGMSVDDKGWSHCFVCETRKKVGDSMETVSSTDKKPNGNFDKLKESLMSGQYKSVVNRGISSDRHTRPSFKARSCTLGIMIRRAT